MKNHSFHAFIIKFSVRYSSTKHYCRLFKLYLCNFVNNLNGLFFYFILVITKFYLFQQRYIMINSEKIKNYSI